MVLRSLSVSRHYSKLSLMMKPLTIVLQSGVNFVQKSFMKQIK